MSLAGSCRYQINHGQGPWRFLLVCILSWVKSSHAFVMFQESFQTQQSTPRKAEIPSSLFSVSGPEAQNEDVRAVSEAPMGRRRALDNFAAVAGSMLLIPTNLALADNDDDATIQRGNGFAYKFVPPPEMEPGAKPVKTHLFEINWKSPTTARYTFGVTVDPVRIQNLKEFGTPEEVAAKVVLAEVNRDGIFEVTLVKDPVAVEEDGILSYILNYLSQGKRGDKRFVAKFCIQNQRLYALTAQVLESDYNAKEAEIMKAVESFRVLP
ncbi:PsbP [Seminavis robusta]|uniref:PsbP n=1 Tax=Seminavis robusta TaxID=568900 RepID=A0A9N8H5J8_9STRA|nr:PsbP [Seminavis robusta]|eukprot:Sro25_g017010.1 PsbP (267) ;mRNA; f:94007-94967